MPRDAITLADVREPAVVIACEPCGRRGRYNVERLMAEHHAGRHS
jgi:RNase P subunit RPR2